MACKIDGVVVRSPDPYDTTFNDISRSYEDIDGVFRDKLKRRKRTTNWPYSCLAAEDYQVIHDVIQAKLDQGSRYFMVTRESPGEGKEYTSLMYLGTPTNFKSLMSTNIDGTLYWQVTIQWIEVIGTKFKNNGSDIPS